MLICSLAVTISLAVGTLTFASNDKNKDEKKTASEREQLQLFIARQAEITRHVEARRNEVSRELAGLKNHEWAGNYYQGNGFAGRSLLLAPHAGAVFESAGCMGLGLQNYGKVAEQHGRIRVHWEGEHHQNLAEELLVVRWSDRRYLVPTEEILEFCQSLHSKGEPRNLLLGSYYLRYGDEKKAAQGQPQLPKGFERYLTMKPIEASIIKLGPEIAEGNVYGTDKVRHAIVINAGGAEGVLPKMSFKVTDPDRPDIYIQINRVEEHESEAVLHYYRNAREDPPRPRAYWKVTTGQ